MKNQSYVTGKTVTKSFKITPALMDRVKKNMDYLGITQFSYLINELLWEFIRDTENKNKGGKK